MSKTLYFGAFLLLIAVVLVSCSSFEVQVHDLQKKHHDGKKHHDKNNNKHHDHHDLEHPSRRHRNKHSSEYFDENMKPNEAAIKKLFFGDKAHLFNKQQTDMVLNASKTIPVGIALTFAPSFFANLFNVIVLPQIQAIADAVNIPGYSFGLPGPGGQGSIDGVAIRNFDIQIGQLVPTYPSTFNWALNQISVSITGSWSVKWEIKLCPCFGHCCFHITLFHCSGPFGVYADDISITGTMNFVQTGTTVQVESPSGAQWHNSPTVNLNIHCGWFIDAILSVLKFFGLNVWGMVQTAINGAITKAFQGGALGAATNKILDDTVNAAFNGIHICGFKFYPGQSFMTIFTHETSDPSSPCLSDILPTPWLQTAPAHDITLLARIETLFPAYLPPKSWDMICLPLPQSWFNLPGGLGSLMRVDDVTTCAGLDSNLGIYLVGEIDVSFFVSSEYEVRRQVQPFVREANRIIAAEFAHSNALVQQQAQIAFGKSLDSASESCPFKSGLSKLTSSSSSSSGPWWTCANIPLLEKVLSALPACFIALTLVAVSYRVFGSKKKQTFTQESKAAPQLVIDEELSNKQ